jgi:hypothetical protein
LFVHKLSKVEGNDCNTFSNIILDWGWCAKRHAPYLSVNKVVFLVDMLCGGAWEGCEGVELEEECIHLGRGV